MADKKYITAPIPSKKMPAGVPYILSNEMAERFAFYGMTSILVIYMTTHLMGRDGKPDVMGDEEAKTWFHLFKSAVYFLPILGALLSDIWLAKYKTIIIFSAVYCVGFFALLVDQTRLGLGLALVLMAVGGGVIKPCVSANVGDQFGKTNQHLLSKIYGWFYFSINLGAGISMWFCPELRAKYGPQVAFAVPALFMALATLTYWMGRRKFVHTPAGGWRFVKETLSGEGLKALGKLCIIFLFVAMFWALFDQSQSAWVLQATKMNLKVWKFELLPEQPQAFNPWLVMIMIPLFSYSIYPALNKVFRTTALRKISIGLFVAAIAFALTAWVETKINGGDIVKYSSMANSLWPTNVLDGHTGTAGWSSSGVPTEEDPEELVIRLRERQKWMVSSIEIHPSTTLSKREIAGILDAGCSMLDAGIENRESRIEKLKAAARRAKKAKNAGAAKSIALAAMSEVGLSTRCLEHKLYYPKDISFFAADFTGKSVPKLTLELRKTKQQLEKKLEKIRKRRMRPGSPPKRQRLEKELTDKIREIDAKLAEPVEFLKQSGWIHLTDAAFSPAGKVSVFSFEPVAATHILVQVKSNYGADRVKVDEISVLTTQTMPERSRITAAQVWPNVAAIGFKPHISWQLLMYVILTAAEIMVSITCLEFSYTQAPKKMKSFVQAVFLMSIAVGNGFTALVNWFIKNEDSPIKLEGASYYWFFTVAMVITAVIFIFVAARYREKTYIQDETHTESMS